MLYELIFLMFVVSAIYSIYSICKRTGGCMLVRIQMQEPTQQQQQESLQPTINNYTPPPPLFPPIIIRCDTFDHIEKENNSSYESCAICLDKYELTTRVAILENCKHMFHDQCITDWFKRSHHCPLCNT